MNNPYHDVNRKLLIGAYIVLGLFLIYTIGWSQTYIKDAIALLACLTLIFIVERKTIIPTPILLLTFIVFLTQLFGIIFSLYGVYFFGIRYDKHIHFLNTFIVTILAYTMFKKGFSSKTGAIFVAMVFLLGLGAIVEVGEFIGTSYFNLYGSTMFAQGERLSGNDVTMQFYDTGWDMIVDTLGAVAAGIVLAFVKTKKLRVQHRRS